MSTPRGAPDDQLRTALRMIEAAFDEKARSLDHELQTLRSYSAQQRTHVATLERRVEELESAVREGNERSRQLVAEKSQLEQELKTTQRNYSKLDSFKRNILQQLQADGLPGDEGGVVAYEAPRAASSDFTPYSVPRDMPPPASYSASALGPNTPAVVGASTVRCAASPAPGDTPSEGVVMDGKDFFRQARLRLTYEQFNQFLSNIKRLNDHAQTRGARGRHETLSRAQEIFGPDNSDLFSSFKSLLSKHGLTT